MAAVAAMLLGACTTLNSGGRERVDWPAYGASVQAEPMAARQRLHAEALAAHRAAPTAATAIRLAVLTASLGPEERDLDAALDLLDFAESDLAAGDEASLAFVRFYRPVIGELRETQAALAIEATAREALVRQLDALRELEERLNADNPDR